MNKSKIATALFLGFMSVPNLAIADLPEIFNVKQRLGAKTEIGVAKNRLEETLAMGVGLYYQIRDFAGAYGVSVVEGNSSDLVLGGGVHLLSPNYKFLRGYLSLGSSKIMDYGIQVKTAYINEISPIELPNPTLTFGGTNLGEGGFRIGFVVGSLSEDKKKK